MDDLLLKSPRRCPGCSHTLMSRTILSAAHWLGCYQETCPYSYDEKIMNDGTLAIEIFTVPKVARVSIYHLPLPKETIFQFHKPLKINNHLKSSISIKTALTFQSIISALDLSDKLKLWMTFS